MDRIDSKVFRDAGGEAVSLPEAVAFGEEIEVTITRVGDTLTIEPKGPHRMTPQELVLALERLPKPNEIQSRELVEPPERRGL